MASVGHIGIFPKSKLGIDIENDFEPEYISIRGKGDLIKELKKKETGVKVYLATDPDREGEAISWHLAYLLGIDPSSDCRIVFNEITKDTIKAAVKAPKAHRPEAGRCQQARRVLDRLVGYEISPLLWRKIRRRTERRQSTISRLEDNLRQRKPDKNFIPKNTGISMSISPREKVLTPGARSTKAKLGDRQQG